MSGMEKSLRIFSRPEFGKIRTLETDGAPWFVGRDVAAALGYSNTNKALVDHVEPEDKRQGDGVTIRDPIGREQHPVIINESGLYSLIFSSKLPVAKQFKRWVTSEVLPAIRRTGIYSARSHPVCASEMDWRYDGIVKSVEEISERIARLERTNATVWQSLALSDECQVETKTLHKTAQLSWDTLKRLDCALGGFGEIQISNRRLARLARIRAVHTLIAGRKELIDAGYIAFSPGVKGSPSIYQITHTD